MATYITQDGIKLTANSSAELLNQLQQAQPQLKQVISSFVLEEIPSRQQQLTINTDHAIANLIQRDYLRVVDVIDG